MSFLLEDRCSEALVAVLTPVVPAGVGLYPFKASGDKVLPCVICVATGYGEEDPKGTGNFWVDAGVIVKHFSVIDEDSTGTLPNPKTDDQSLVSAVFGALMVDNLADLLSAAVPDFTVFPQGVIFQAPTSSQDELGVWINELSIKLYCCGSDLATGLVT